MKTLLTYVLCFILGSVTIVSASKYGYITITTPLTKQTAELVLHDLNDVAKDLTVAMTTTTEECDVQVSAICVPKNPEPYCGDGVINQSWETCDGKWMGTQTGAEVRPIPEGFVCNVCTLFDRREPKKEIPKTTKPIIRPSKPVYILPPTGPSNGLWRAIPMSELLKLKLNK